MRQTTRSIGKTLMAAVILLVACVLTCRLALSVAASKGGELAGFVSSVKGTADLARGKRKPVAMEGMNSLRIGDTVRVLPKSAIVVNLCGSGAKLEVKGDATFTVERSGLSFKKGKAAQGGKVEKTFCNTLAGSADKFDRAAAIKKDVAESIGAMSVLGVISTKGGGADNIQALRDVLNDEKAMYESSFENMEMARKSEKSELALGGVGGGYDYDVSAGGGYDDYAAAGGIAAPQAEPPSPADDYYFSDGTVDGALAAPTFEYPPNLVNKYVTTRAFISWAPVHDAQKYEVSIRNAVNAEIFMATTDKPYLTYPANAANPLSSGEWYLCEVKAYFGSGTPVADFSFGLDVVSRAVENRLLVEEKALLKAAEAGGAAGNILVGKLYESYYLLTMAVASYEKALAAEPGNATLKAHVDELKGQLREL